MDKQYRKYKLVLDKDTNATGLYRLKALRDFNNVKAGDLGGFVDKETNLSHEGNCWIYDDAVVRKSTILDNALIRGKAIVTDSYICDEVLIIDDARVTSSEIRDNVFIHQKPNIIKCVVKNNVDILGTGNLINSSIFNCCRIYGNGIIINCSFRDTVRIDNEGELKHVIANHAVFIKGNVYIDGYVHLYDSVVLNGSFEIHDSIDIKKNAIIHSKEDFIIFKNWWSSGRNFIWTRSNNMWNVGCFYGTGKELIKKAHLDNDDSCREYTRIVNYVEDILDKDKPKLVRLFNHIKRNIKLFI